MKERKTDAEVFKGKQGVFLSRVPSFIFFLNFLVSSFFFIFGPFVGCFFPYLTRNFFIPELSKRTRGPGKEVKCAFRFQRQSRPRSRVRRTRK